MKNPGLKVEKLKTDLCSILKNHVIAITVKLDGVVI
jgi:hypothetical protein